MGNSLTDDYFSFMSDRSERRLKLDDQIATAIKAKPAVLGDTIDYVEEPQIEVIETVASDTIIEKLFNLRRRFGTSQTP